MSSRKRFAALILVPVLLAGCTAHYRRSLRDYESGKTTSFLQKTLEWSAEAQGEPSPPTLSAGPLAAPSPATSSQTLIAKVLNGDVGNATDLPARLALKVEFRDLLAAVALQNPEIRAAHAEYQATLRQYSQAEFLEGLLGQFRSFTRYLDVETGQPLNRQMSQVYPGVAAYKGEMIRQMARMAELEWQMTLRDKLIEAGELFFEYQYLVRAQAATRENIDLVTALVGVTEERYRTGLVNQTDVLKAQNELAAQQNALLDLESRERSARAALNALLGRPVDAPLGEPSMADLAAPDLSAEKLTAAALSQRQEIGIQEAAIARTEAAIRMSEVMNRPAASRGYGNFERGMMPESTTAEPQSADALTMADASSDAPSDLTFGDEPSGSGPSFGFAQAEAYLAETRTRLRGDRLRLENLKLETGALVRAAAEDINIARREVEFLVRTTYPQIQRAYEISLNEYTAGSVTFVDLSDTERQLLATRIMVHEARRDHNQAVLRLARVTGRLAGD